LNATVLNALIVYRRNCDKPVEHSSFKVLLVEGLFSKYRATGERKVGQPGRHTSDNMIPRLTEHNFLRKVQPRGGKARPQRRCVVCTKHGRKKETVYCCRECNVGLCLEDCFEAYHTELNYKGNEQPPHYF
jgi:hypothetical protein